MGGLACDRMETDGPKVETVNPSLASIEVDDSMSAAGPIGHTMISRPSSSSNNISIATAPPSAQPVSCGLMNAADMMHALALAPLRCSSVPEENREIARAHRIESAITFLASELGLNEESSNTLRSIARSQKKTLDSVQLSTTPLDSLFASTFGCPSMGTMPIPSQQQYAQQQQYRQQKQQCSPAEQQGKKHLLQLRQVAPIAGAMGSDFTQWVQHGRQGFPSSRSFPHSAPLDCKMPSAGPLLSFQQQWNIQSLEIQVPPTIFHRTRLNLLRCHLDDSGSQWRATQ
jgi:hypothetical protein